TWCFALLPPRFWIRWYNRSRGKFLYGLSTGCIAYVLGNWTQLLWPALQASTFLTVAVLLRAVAVHPTVLEPNQSIIGTSTFSVRIAPVCSGLEGMTLIC